MKKLSYLLMAIAALCIVSCEKKPGYHVTGSVEGAVDGDSVYLQELTGRKLVNVDSTVIEKGTFSFKGAQNAGVYRFLTCPKGEATRRIDFFLENGIINVIMTKDYNTATGTSCNDIYQGFRDNMKEIDNKAEGIYTSLKDSTLTDQYKEYYTNQLTTLSKERIKVIKEVASKNIANPVGLQLFKQNFLALKLADVEEILQKVPSYYLEDEDIVKIKESIDKKKQTAPGQKFIDFEMQTPDGKPVKLSDYVGKGKVVLVDFWASWCGPCREEMPNLVSAYNKYKNKKFEIVGVSLDQNADAWKNGIKTLGITWPQMSDLKDGEGAKIYGINSIPHVVLIDGEGTIIARDLHGNELLAVLADVLK